MAPTKSAAQDNVHITHCDDGCVVHNEDVLNGNRRHLADQDAAQRVGDGGVDADHVELDTLGAEVVDLDAADTQRKHTPYITETSGFVET